MKFKTKLVAMMTVTIMAISMLIIGVLSATQVNLGIGGNVSFIARGINCAISSGEVSGGTKARKKDGVLQDGEIMSGFTYSTESVVDEDKERAFKESWTYLDLNFNESGDKMTLSFTITNNSELTSSDCIAVSIDPSSNMGTGSNMKEIARIFPPLITPGSTKEYSLVFEVDNKEINASINDFNIIVKLEYQEVVAVDATSGYNGMTFSPITENESGTVAVKSTQRAKRAEVKATENTLSGEVVIPSRVILGGEIYDVVKIADAESVDNKMAGAFYNCTGITSIVLPGTLEEIGRYGLAGTSISQLQVPSGLKVLAEGALSASNITSFEIPYGIESISENAFRNCNNLTSIVIPHSVKIIGVNAFCGASFAEVNIPNSVTKIDGGAFNASQLRNINIPDSVTSIVTAAFAACQSLEKVIIPDSVTSIGMHAFRDCYELKEVVIGNGVKEIEDYTFYYCGVKSIKIGDGVESIGAQAFEGCSLTSLTIPDSVISIGANAFGWCSSLQELKLGKGLKTIGDGAFGGLIVSSLNIPESVTSIGSGAFSGDNLEELSIGGSELTIGNGAFSQSSTNKLIALTIRKGFVSNGLSEYFSSNSIKSINFMGTLEEWFEFDSPRKTSGNANGHLAQDWKFLLNGEEVHELVIPESVTEVFYQTFIRCGSLTSVVFHDKMTQVYPEAFAICNNLKSAYIDDDNLTLQQYCFVNCDNLTDISLGGNNLTLGNCAFGLANYKVGTNLFVEKGIQSITTDNYPFFRRYINSIYFEGTMEEWFQLNIINNLSNFDMSLDAHWKFYLNGEEVSELIIPEGITEIPENAFIYCKSIVSVKLPFTLTQIGNTSFDACIHLVEVINNSALTNEQIESCMRHENLYIRSESEPTRVQIIDDFVFFDKVGETTTKYLVSYIGQDTNLILPNNVGDYAIRARAFYCDFALESVVIPSSVIKIETDSFWDCRSLNMATFEEITGWKVVNSSNESTNLNGIIKDGSSLENKQSNANLLRATYRDYTWTRTVGA